MELPAIITNFKTYESAIGERALGLARVHQEVAQEKGVSLGVIVSALDLAAVARELEIPVFIQHVDAIDFGANTGFIPPLAAKDFGAYGALLNHAEHQLSMEYLGQTIAKCKEVSLFTLVCAESIEKGADIMQQFVPDLIALEPPELIGGNVSVSSAQPELIRDAVAKIGGDKLLVGAGVKTAQDVKTAITLGSSGVLLASGVTKAESPKDVLYDLAQGLS